jgi:murein DD-endopeptidase MepM/ murein hydrolase activator NlpD
MISPIGEGAHLGHLIAIEHAGLFAIPEETATVNGETYQYPAESVTRVISIYVHVTPKPGLEIHDRVRAGELIATLANISYPHLHFEIRHPSQIPSGDWSLVQPQSNWQVIQSTSQYNGYYKNVQQMVDSGLRNPTRFLEEN